MSAETIGKSISRVDGPLKVTGQARYAAEFPLPNLAHAVIVQSSVSRGAIVSLETRDAQKVPGILAIITHKNAPRLNRIKPEKTGGGMAGTNLQPLQDNQVHYDGQHIAVVIGESLESAQRGAELLKIKYESSPAEFEIETAHSAPERVAEHFGRPLQLERGDVHAALAQARTVLDQTYTTPAETHNPIELAVTIAAWEGERLTAYNSTQGIIGDQNMISRMLEIPLDRVRVICPYLGGGFGCKGSMWPHTILAAVAAQKVNRPVKLVLTRSQMFSSLGHRGKTIQRVTLAADEKGTLSAVRHATRTEASVDNDFIESAGLASAVAYASPSAEISHELYRLNIAPTAQMRAPGEAPGMFALESAIDELACALAIDPLELRLRNYSDSDPQSKKPWSSKHLKKCYSKAAEAFGWSKRNPLPRSMRDGNVLIGWGMATAIYPGNRSAASARATMTPDGLLTVESATQDIGTGTYTIMSQIAADAMGVPLERVKFVLGDSTLPKAPVSGGSQTAASVGPAVRQAVESLRNMLIKMSVEHRQSPLNGVAVTDLAWGDSRIFLKADEKTGQSYAEIVQRSGQPSVVAEATAQLASKEALTKEIPPPPPNTTPNESGAGKDEFSFYSWGAQFAEVRVDPDLCEVRVSRVVSAFDVGRILNEKTARSQAIGGIVWGIGTTLLEETVRDPKTGRLVNANLADYRVPVNADVPDIDIIFINEPDPHINSMGSRGIGEIGITGITAAIANAVFHATGKRVRDLPITIDKLL